MKNTIFPLNNLIILWSLWDLDSNPHCGVRRKELNTIAPDNKPWKEREETCNKHSSGKTTKEEIEQAEKICNILFDSLAGCK